MKNELMMESLKISEDQNFLETRSDVVAGLF